MRKGGCFTCEEKYNPTHVCKNRQFKLMIMEEEEERDPKSQQWEDEEEEMGEFGSVSTWSAANKVIQVWPLVDR